MPAKGKSKVTEHQKKVMAVGKLTGKTSRQVAAEVDLHPKTVRQYWGGHESLNLQLKREHAPTIRKLYGKMLTKTNRHMDSKDERVSILACRQVISVVTAGDPPLERVVPPPPPQPEGQIIRVTLEELLISYRRASIEEVAKKPEDPQDK